MAWNKMVPFDKDGNMVSYAWDYDEYDSTYDWRPNYQFEETLTIVDTYKGRSAVHFNVADSRGKQYSMFLSAFLWLVKNCDISGGKVTGKWTFEKKGSNFGLTHI